MKPKPILCLALVLVGDGYAAIVYPKAPEGGREVVVENVSPLVRKHPDGTLAVPGLTMEEVTLGSPHRMYAVGAKDLAAGHLLSSAGSRSWRYILLHGTNAVGVASVSEGNSITGEALSFSGLSQTAFSAETLEALRRAEALPQTKKVDYEVRFLEIAAINFVAVWLHGKSDDIILPLPPTFGRTLKAYQPYSERPVIEALKPEANNVMKAPRLIR